MSRIVGSIDDKALARTVALCREKKIIIPTFKQLRDPSTLPATLQGALEPIGLWDVHPLNLFRITWKNDVNTGLFGGVNHFEIPSSLTGVKARIVGLVGKYFPTGAHKVGAAFGCLVPRLVTGAFDPGRHKAVWPSTGNYCRGGAFDGALLGCVSIAILPEEMSQERFTWLRKIGAEVIATPGCESNVKEIYDKCWELRQDPNNVIFNQFDELGNSIFHYQITGPAIEEVLGGLGDPNARLAAYVSSTGSAGTIAAGDYLKTVAPAVRIVAGEALQCPTLLRNGYGGHRIEGIGDKHVPWIHNVRNTDAVAAIDDEDCYRVLRLFNTDDGRRYLASHGVDEATLQHLPLLGISGIGNLLAAIKTAKYFELDEHDVIFTVFTDSMDMYQSRLDEAVATQRDAGVAAAASDYERALLGQGMDHYKELGYYDRKALHNLKYFTWVEQQGKTVQELDELWDPLYWQRVLVDEVEEFDRLIDAFNERVGLQ